MNENEKAQVPAGQHLICPTCQKPQEDKVEDYVIPGRVGPGSVVKDQCEHCYKAFKVECVAPGSFSVYR